MTIRDIYRLTDPFLQDHGYTRKGTVYYQIRDSLAFCILFEPGQGHLYCNYCIIPLYMPSDSLYLTYGTRMETYTRYALPPLSRDQSDDACAAWAESLMECLDRQILPFFEEINTPASLLRFLNRGHRRAKRYLFCNREQYHSLRAYTAFLVGSDRQAKASIRIALRAASRDATYPETYTFTRCTELIALNAFLSEPPSERAQYIQDIVSETQSNLFVSTPKGE